MWHYIEPLDWINQIHQVQQEEKQDENPTRYHLDGYSLLWEDCQGGIHTEDHQEVDHQGVDCQEDFQCHYLQHLSFREYETTN
jgi:hypothetical protein